MQEWGWGQDSNLFQGQRANFKFLVFNPLVSLPHCYLNAWFFIEFPFKEHIKTNLFFLRNKDSPCDLLGRQLHFESKTLLCKCADEDPKN